MLRAAPQRAAAALAALAVDPLLRRRRACAAAEAPAAPQRADWGGTSEASSGAARRGDSVQHGPLRVFAGNAHTQLAQNIAARMGVPLSDATVGRFNCGEVNVIINENVRDCDVFVIQPTCNGGAGPQEHLVELLIMLDAIRRGSPNRLTAVMPLFGYARQNAKDRSRSPITARLMTDIIQVAGAQAVLTVELHAPQIQGFASYPIDNLFAMSLIAEELQSVLASRGWSVEDLVVVSPDVGGTKRASLFAKMLCAPLAIFSRQRRRKTEAAEVDLVGDVSGKVCVVVDDIADTAGTLVHAAAKLKERGAEAVIGACVHGVFSEPALESISGSQMELLIVTDTIPMEDKVARCPKLRVVSVAPLLASAILRLHKGKGPNENAGLLPAPSGGGWKDRAEAGESPLLLSPRDGLC